MYIIHLQDALGLWRTKISSSTQEWDERNRALRNEKDIMTRHYRGLKSSMDHFRAAQSQRLKCLSVHSEKSAMELKEKLKKGENILKLTEMCRKLETEQEKILPFCSSLTQVKVDGIDVLKGVPSSENTLMEIPEMNPAQEPQIVKKDADGPNQVTCGILHLGIMEIELENLTPAS